jgi:hypothetical protein
MKALTFLKIFTALNVVIATGFAVAGIVSPHLLLAANITTDKAITVFALYAGARGIPIATLTIMSVFRRHWNAFITLAVVAGLIQFLDGFIGIYEQDLSKTVGPFIIAAIQFAAIYMAVSNNNKINDRMNKENIA